MNKIVQLISSVQLGGAENVAIDLAQLCTSSQLHSFHIVIIELYSSPNNYSLAKKKQLKELGIDVMTLYNGSKRRSLLLAPFRLLEFIRKEKPIIIHSHTDLPDFVLSITLRLLKSVNIKSPRIVRTIHNTQLWRNRPYMGRITEKAFLNDNIIAVSENALEAYMQLRKKFRLPPSLKRQVIYNGISFTKRKDHDFILDETKTNVIFCGRFEDYKGMDTIMIAIPEIEKRYPGHFAFHFVGDGPYKEKLTQLSYSSDNVRVYLPIPNISTMLHNFDYLLMPSHFEGLGLVSVEASLSGVPSILSYAPGLDETLPASWPLRFNRTNLEELYKIFDNIRNDIYDKNQLKKEAYYYVKQKFNLKNMMNLYSRVYEEMQ